MPMSKGYGGKSDGVKSKAASPRKNGTPSGTKEWERQNKKPRGASWKNPNSR